jgi:hypothetical protein
VAGITGGGGQGLQLAEIGAGAGEEEEVSGHADAGLTTKGGLPDMDRGGAIVQSLTP